MKCPSCNEETRGRDQNGRGIFCIFCMARLPLTQPESETVVIEDVPVITPEMITVEDSIKVNPAVSEIDLSHPKPEMVIIKEEPARLPFIEPETTAVKNESIKVKLEHKGRPRKVRKAK